MIDQNREISWFYMKKTNRKFPLWNFIFVQIEFGNSIGIRCILTIPLIKQFHSAQPNFQLLSNFQNGIVIRKGKSVRLKIAIFFSFSFLLKRRWSTIIHVARLVIRNPKIVYHFHSLKRWKKERNLCLKKSLSPKRYSNNLIISFEDEM